MSTPNSPGGLKIHRAKRSVAQQVRLWGRKWRRGQGYHLILSREYTGVMATADRLAGTVDFCVPFAYAVMHRIFTECVLRIRDWRVTLMKRKEWEKRMSPFHVTIVKRLKHTNRQTDMETGTWLSKPQQGAYLPQSDGLFLQAP